MSTFAEKKAAAKAAARKFKDVVVSLDNGAGDERDELLRQLAGAKDSKDKRLTQKVDTAAIEARLAAIEAAERDTLVTVRLYLLPPLEWVKLTAANGYNLVASCSASLPQCGRILDGDTELTQTAEEWADLWTTTSVADVNAVFNAIYEQNVTEPAQRLERVKNSLGAATASAKK